jgi:broad specificity phosphatase PhoE
LTDHGILQAISLSAFYQSQWFTSASDLPNYFWRIYSSDLQRTKHTTQILLSNTASVCTKEFSSIGFDDFCATAYDPNDTVGVNFGVRYDSRLREIARGLNQGLPKHFTPEQAAEIFKSGKHPLYSCHDTAVSWPVSESHDDVWDRVFASWLMEVVHDVTLLCQSGRTENGALKCTLNCVNVLAVTHGALLRLFLKRLIGEERLRDCCDACFKTVAGSNGQEELRLDVPNTSVTVLDIHIDAHTFEIVRTEIVQLTSIEHFELIGPK